MSPTSAGFGVSTGRCETPGPTGVGGCDSKLVPTAWPDVGEPDSLFCGLREVGERHLMNPHSLRK